MKKIAIFVALFFFCHQLLYAQDTPVVAAMDHAKGTHIMLNTIDLKWGDGPPSLPPGVKMAVIAGDPSKEGMFTLRAMLPADYKIPPHWHPTTENVTVLEGELYMGNGETFDKSKTTMLRQGGFSSIPEKTAHFVFTKGKCTIQVHAMGPFAITYINPADAPVKK